MPLSTSAPRKALHARTIVCDSFQRDDGLWDVEAHLVDTRDYTVSTSWRGEMPKGVPMHDMWMRITFDDELIIQSLEAVTDAAPYPPICPGATESYQRLVGMCLGKGFLRKARELISGTAGCAHLAELLRVLSIMAFRIHGTQIVRKLDSGSEYAGLDEGVPLPMLINTCHGFADDNEVVAGFWPELHTGSKQTS